MFSFSIMVRVFANGPGDWGSIPGRVIPKTQKIVLDTSLLNTQHYKVYIYMYVYIYVYIYIYIYIGLMSRVFANDPGDQVSIPGRVIPKTQKVVLDAALLNTQYYKVLIKGK